jgi:hypothetical protein
MRIAPAAASAAHRLRSPRSGRGAEPRAELVVVGGELVEIAVEEPPFSTSIQQQVQPQPEVVDRRRARKKRMGAVVAHAQTICRAMCEIAGADAHLVGDVRSRDARRAVAIEELEAGLENALASAPGTFSFCHGRPRTGRAGAGPRRV